MSGSAGEKTEAPTPKRREESRKKGQVARSADLNGAVVLIAGIGALMAGAPLIYAHLAGAMRDGLRLAATPDVVSPAGLGLLFGELGKVVALSVAPVAGASLVAGVIISVLQVKWKPSAQILKPDPRKINPLTGAKNLLGTNALVESVKNTLKVMIVGAVVLATLLPDLPRFAALVGMPAGALLAELCRLVIAIALKAAAAYLVLSFGDYLWQRHRHEKQLKMSKEEVRQEAKGQDVSPEVKGAIKRRQMETARARMMADVPEADVVVTNPTHYAVALKYDSEHAAPVVVAKGKDLIAAKIREIARENGVPVVPDPPLARSLHASVEVGHLIPEELYQAVAQLLAFVYRTAGRRRLAARSAAA